MSDKTCETCLHVRRQKNQSLFCAHPDPLQFATVKHGVPIEQMETNDLCSRSKRRRWVDRGDAKMRFIKIDPEWPERLDPNVIKRLNKKDRAAEIVIEKTLAEEKRKRGRPPSRPKPQARPNWARFNCIYANGVAQVYQCSSVANTRTGMTKEKRDDPVAHFHPGDCFITLYHRRDGEYVTDLWAYPDIPRLTAAEATEKARQFFFETDPDERFGDNPDTHERGQYILYANPVFDVRYWSDNDKVFNKPFIVFHRRMAKILVNGGGRTHRFTTLQDAIAKADELFKPYRHQYIGSMK